MESEQNHVPEGWISARIDDIVEVNPGKPPRDLLPSDAPVSFVPMPAVDAEQGAITEPEVRPYHKVRSGYTAFRDDDLIVAKITPCMENGKAAVARDLVNGLGFGSSEFHVLRSRGAVLPEYLYHFVRQQSYRDSAAKQMTGSVGQKRVPADYIKQTIVTLPPLAEQRRIVAQLKALLADVERVRGRLEGVAVTMQRFREAVLAAACEGQLTAEWRETNGTKIDEWKIVTVGDISNLITSGSRAWKPFYSDTGASTFILAQNVKPMELNLSVQQRVDPPQNDRERDRTRVQREDILVTIVGANTGDCCRVTDELSDHYVCQSVALIRLNDPLVSCYTEIYLNSPKHGEKQFNEFIYGMGLPHLGLNHLRQTIIQLPPLAEQHEIVRRVDALFALADRIEGEVTGALERVEALTQAVLAKAFRGELVPTEAELARREGREYEPADALLERVRAGREAGRQKTPGRAGRPSGQTALPGE